MRALVVDLGLARAAATVARGRFDHAAAWRRGGVLEFTEVPPPLLPGPDWVRLRPSLTGICGSDLKLLHVTGFSAVLSAYSPQRRMIPGHELTGTITECGGAVTEFDVGETVLVEPTLRCLHKGFSDCAACTRGDGHLCENLAEAGSLCSGQGIGFALTLGGGWSEEVVLHRTMLQSAAGIPAKRAVVAEPAAVALHAALRWPRQGDRVAVIGTGSIGLMLTAALRRLHPGIDICMIGPAVATMDETRSIEAGADRLWHVAPASVMEHAAHHLGTTLRRPRFGGMPVLDGGFDAVFDCVASEQTLDVALRLLRGRGELIVVGTASKRHLDWSLVWWRELVIRGAVVYGEERATGGSRTFAQVREWLQEPGPLDLMVTHVVPIKDYADALTTAMAGLRAGAIKVVMAWDSP